MSHCAFKSGALKTMTFDFIRRSQILNLLNLKFVLSKYIYKYKYICERRLVIVTESRKAADEMFFGHV